MLLLVFGGICGGVVAQCVVGVKALLHSLSGSECKQVHAEWQRRLERCELSREEVQGVLPGMKARLACQLFNRDFLVIS